MLSSLADDRASDATGDFVARQSLSREFDVATRRYEDAAVVTDSPHYLMLESFDIPEVLIVHIYAYEYRRHHRTLTNLTLRLHGYRPSHIAHATAPRAVNTEVIIRVENAHSQ
jgi:hypothetical protein